MSDHFNGLTPAQAESLALLLEELGEAQQAIGKIMRHGLDSHHPDGGPDNRATLQRELGDVLAAIEIARDLNIVTERGLLSTKNTKLGRVGRYLHHIEPCEAISPGDGNWREKD